jgi:hypothetical protein
MAARDILTLNTPMADRIIRLLYTIALILIAIGTLMGIGRGVMIMTHTPMQRPAITAGANPSNTATTPQPGTAAPQADTQTERRDFRDRSRGDFRGWNRYGDHRPFGMMHRSPMFGLLVILGALLRGLIGLLILRVLAEIGLAILAMPKRSTA